MKKSILLCLFISLIVTQSADARPVDGTKAKKIALNWIFEKSGIQRDAKKLTIATTEKIGSDNIYYVLNFAQGGWAIVAADDVAYPVIGFSPTGTYSPDNHPIQFDQWMENVKNKIHGAIGKKDAPLPEAANEWARLNVDSDSFSALPLDYDTPPLLTTTWNQGTYYNASCPADGAGPGGYVWTGCVATAMGQVMKYHNHPATGSGAHSYEDDTYGTQSADFGATTYDWTSMPDSLSDYNSAVATLLYHAGVSVEMDYETTGSGANVSVVTTNALKTNFKYSDKLYFASKADYTPTEWMTLLQTELNNNRPILYRGDGSGGHAFVCDGYSGAATEYFHFNWGWGGYLDGYFYLNALTPGDSDYSNNQGGIMGVTPALDPQLQYTYSESFETGLPSEWATSGSRVSIVTNEHHEGINSLRLSTPDEAGFLEDNTASLSINVPAQGGTLSFWVKRGYDPAASQYNQQTASLQSQFGGTLLHTIYVGNFNDSQWQEYNVDLLPWAGTNIKLIVSQFNSSTTWKEWTHLDDIVITSEGRPVVMPTINNFFFND